MDIFATYDHGRNIIFCNVNVETCKHDKENSFKSSLLFSYTLE